jgi:hypothetical protein
MPVCHSGVICFVTIDSDSSPAAAFKFAVPLPSKSGPWLNADKHVNWYAEHGALMFIMNHEIITKKPVPRQIITSATQGVNQSGSHDSNR